MKADARHHYPLCQNMLFVITMLASVCSMCWSWVGWWGRVHVVMADWAVHGGRVGAQYKHQLSSIWVPLWDGGMERVSENQGCHRLWDVEFAFKILSIHLSSVSVKSNVTAQFGLFPERLLEHCSTGKLERWSSCSVAAIMALAWIQDHCLQRWCTCVHI